MFDSITRLAKRVFGDANERELKRIQPLVQRINDLEREFEQLSDDRLAAKTAEFKQQVENGAPLDDLLCEAFAAVREAGKRTLGQRHYDCQLVGGVVLHQGKIAEMKTGEGKTLVATLPVYLNALEGNGVHVVTVNDYLAARDADWMGVIYNLLGMSVGKILSNERNDVIKREAYTADITYGTNNEFGFDYLRDNMKFRLEDYVQRGHRYGIVDEVDSILVDEARTPLIISGPADADVNLYYIVDAIIPLLQDEIEYTVDEKGKNVTLTDEGVVKVERRLGIDNLFDPHNMEVLHHVNQSLKAHHVFKRDRDYVVRDGKVIIVDEFTGRLMHGRRWSDGLHQGVEAKEKVEVENESQTYATITFQNLFRMYDKLSGMTGTASTEAAEFAAIYDLDTIILPTNVPLVRDDREDIVYKTQMEKFRAVMEDIRESHGKGQPVLVGTTSVEKSEIVAKLLERAKIPHEVLNAKNHAREALIVAQAGRKGVVTISTNMAGRGTDIVLGGNPVELAKEFGDPETEPEKYEVSLVEARERCTREQKEVLAAGGLHIIGTERHESRRIDNQLRGRAGRQGDPGSSRFYMSLEDDLLRIFGSDKITVWMERMGLQDDEPIEHRWITRAIENAQKKVEGHNFQIRKNLLEYDDVMNYQRKGVYDLRKKALGGENITGMIKESLDNVVFDIMDEACGDLHPESWRIETLRERLLKVFGITWKETDLELRDNSKEELKERMLDEAGALLDARIEEMGTEVFEQIGRMLLLQFADQLWKDHLLAIDRLRQGVGLRGYGQRNPLLEYKREAFNMFLMMSALRDEAILQKLFQADARIADAAAARPSKAMARHIAADGMQPAPVGGPAGGPSGAAPTPLPLPVVPQRAPRAPARPQKGDETRAFAEKQGVGRNEPCPCGSGRKYKKCCGSPQALQDAAQP
ncbi:MAG: preprotein translocase subunit SecA [Deltaproteobacteria bacterium]|nr:preprotein translocase subunit SecA [Deltaproteobacteria bacterium]